MTDLTEYKAAARRLCDLQFENPDDGVMWPGTSSLVPRWRHVAHQLHQHDLMNRALAHERAKSTDDKALLAGWNAWIRAGDPYRNHKVLAEKKATSFDNKAYWRHQPCEECCRTYGEYLEWLKAAIAAYERAKG